MGDDLSKLKAGQQPQGVNIPRKFDNPPAPAPKPAAPTPPTIPTPAKPVPSSMMPPSVKSAPLPSAPKPSPAPVPATPKSVQMPPVAGAMPPAKPSPEIKPGSQFYTPSAAKGASSGNRTMLFAGIAVAAVIFGGLYWYLVIRDSEEITETPIETFTPRPTATPVQDILGMLFPTQGGAIVLPVSGDPSSAFSSAINAQPGVNPGTFVSIEVRGGTSSASAQSFTISELLDRFAAPYPSQLKSVLGEDSKILIYGQKESFDSKGRPIANGVPGRRLVLVSEVASASASILQGWEKTMSTDLANIMAITSAKNTGPFQETNYQSNSVRFKNFSYPDRSIDYALVQQNTKTYLVLAGSREAMFAALDAFQVLGK